MKLPSGILKSSSENYDLELVFQSARDTNEKKKVEFDISDSEFTHSVYNSQLQSSRSKDHTPLLDSSQILDKFLKRDFNESLDLIESNLSDKMLIEFPVFALNEDYVRALSITI
jgi:hypothetical protein